MRISNFNEFLLLEAESVKLPFVMSDILVSVIETINNPISHDLMSMNMANKPSEYTLLDTSLDGTYMISFVLSSMLKRIFTDLSYDDIKNWIPA